MSVIWIFADIIICTVAIILSLSIYLNNIYNKICENNKELNHSIKKDLLDFKTYITNKIIGYREVYNKNINRINNYTNDLTKEINNIMIMFCQLKKVLNLIIILLINDYIRFMIKIKKLKI